MSAGSGPQIGFSTNRDLFTYLQLEQTKAALPQYNLFFNVPERPCTPAPTCLAWNPAYLNGLSDLQSRVVASNAGIWNTSVTAARILSHDGFAFTRGNRLPNGAFFGADGNPPNNNPIPGFGNLILGTNGIETRTTQLLVSIEKPFSEESRWGMTFAYTFTDAKQNRDVNEHYSLDEPTIGQYPFIASNVAARHRWVTTGTPPANPVTFNQVGNILGMPRTLKLQGGVKF